MQNTTADYKLEINKPSRSFECKITIGDNIYTNEDLVNLTLEYIQPQEGFSIGGTISQSLDLTLLNRGDIIYSTSQIKVEIGLKIGSKIEYISMGIFNIDEIEKTDYTTKFTAYDNMIKFETAYFSSLGDKPTLQQVVNELSSKTGVEFTGSLPAYTVSNLDGFSCREVLSYVASICGGNAFITRDGKFTIKTLSEVGKAIDGNNYFDYKREEVKYKVGQISCHVDENNILSKGSTGTDSMELGFENPWITETILTEIYNKLKPVEYLGYSMKWQGDISLDPYDIITVTDIKNVVRKIPILSQKLSYTGGLTSEIGAKGESKNKNSFSSNGNTTNKVNRLVTEQAVIKEALIEKANIKDLEAVSIRTQTLEAKTAKIEEAIIDVAYVSDLTAINANIQTLFANDTTINNALIGKADITQLNAVNGKINVLESDTANIKNLLAGNLSAENIQTGGITSDKLTIANGFITNAMISSLDVSKINAGNISTNKFRIVSDSGKMLIADNTIQIRDNNRVRVQIGKDASNDYSMYVWDSTGKLMFDATGLKADGIKNKIIRDDMISDNANIDGSKINIGSLVTEINKDTNTTVIKSSKVQLDTVGQTLDVAFNSLKSNVDNIKVGGRNYVLKSDAYITGNSYKDFDFSALQELRGKKITVSVEIDLNAAKGSRVGFEPSVEYADGSVQYLGVWQGITHSTTMKTRISATHIIQDKEIKTYQQRGMYIQGVSSGIAKIGRPKLEIGNKATDWTPAPEDINNAIDAVKQVTKSNSTTINLMQGQISTAINNTQIVKDGKTILLKDDYNRTVAKVDSINSIIGSQTAKLDQLTGSIASVDSKVNSVQRDLEGTKSTVSSHTSQINGLNSTVSAQVSSINQLNDQIALKVEKTDITNAINNIQVGGKNLFKGYTDKEFTLNNYKNTGSFTQFRQNLTFDPADYLNKEFTISFYAKSPNGQTELHIYNANESPRYFYFSKKLDTNLSTEWKYYTYTFKNIDRGSSYNVSNKIEIYAPHKMGVLVKKIKIELGNKATDWTPAPEDIDSSISNVNNKIESTTNKVSEIVTSLDSIGLRVQSTENSINSHATQLGQVDGKINNAKNQAVVDSRYIPDTRNANETPGWYISNYACQTITEFKLGSNIGLAGFSYGTLETKVPWVDSSGGYPIQTFRSSTTPTYERKGTSHTTWGAWVQVEDINGSQNKANVAQNNANAYTNGQIASVNQTITDRVADIKLTTDSITSRVHSAEYNISSINGSISNLTSRISTAEQKITPTAITTTISSVITGGAGSISTTQFVMDKNGLAIKNGALTIKNKAGTTVLNSDTNGNLIVTGTLKSQSGEQFVSMNSGGIDFQDWHRKEQMLRIGISYFNSNRDMNGVNFALAQCGDFIRFSHIAKTDLTNGWSSSDTQYNFFDCWSSDQTVGGVSYKKGINIYSPIFVNNGIQLFSGTDYYSEILGAVSWNNGNGTIWNMMGLYGDNGAALGYKNGSNLNARIVVTEGAHPGTGDHIKSWGNWNCSGYTVHNATFSGRFVNSYANLTARTFIKTNCIEAENKQIRINFKDIQLKNGRAILNIPNKYIHINTGYTIASIVKKGKGDVWVAEELEDRFIIEGTEDIKINIEVIIHLENESLYATRKADNSQLCIDMSTGQLEE